MKVSRDFALILVIVTFAIVHEGFHALLAMQYNEYKAFHVRPYGLEVEYNTPVSEREGIKWGFISGTSNVVTLLIGYILFLFRVRMSRLEGSFLNAFGYWLIFFFLLLDTFNLSIGPFIYGGDINGIAVGFGLNRYLVQIVFFVVLLMNRELVVQKLFPAYGVKTKHPLFQPLIKLKDK